jgi:hypothetical protein
MVSYIMCSRFSISVFLCRKERQREKKDKIEVMLIGCTVTYFAF